MENDLQIKSLGIQTKKKQTSRLERIEVVPKLNTKNNSNENVRKGSVVEKKKIEQISLQQKSDTKRRVPSSTRSKNKTNEIKIDTERSRKETKLVSNLDKNIEHKKNRIVETNNKNDDKLTNAKKKNKNKTVTTTITTTTTTTSIAITNTRAEEKKKNETRVKGTEKKIDKKQSNKDEKKYVIDKGDSFLKELLKKDHISVQTDIKEELLENKSNTYEQECVTEKESSEEDSFNLDLIDQYKKKKKKEAEKKKKEELLKRKAQLIKKAMFKDAETQVILDDFFLFYERAKPTVDKMVENILNRALKEILEEEELRKIKEQIDFYENIRMQKFESVKLQEEKNQQFYNEIQQKIKERSDLKKKIHNIIEKKIANRKAQNNIQHIFQKNLDSYALNEGTLSNDFEKNVAIFILPWMVEYFQYLKKVNINITHYALNEILEKFVEAKHTEHCFQLKRRLIQEKEERRKQMNESQAPVFHKKDSLTKNIL